MNRFGPAPGARKMMDGEMLHAVEAIESGTYVSKSCIHSSDASILPVVDYILDAEQEV